MKYMFYILFIFYLFAFCAGCDNEVQPAGPGNNDPCILSGGFPETAPAEAKPEQGLTVLIDSIRDPEYIKQIMEHLQNPEIFQKIPGYYNYRGILAAGNDIYLIGHIRVLGGAYAGGNINMGSSANIQEDCAYILKVYDNFNNAGASKANLNLFPGVSGFSHPLNMDKIPKRARVIQTKEIQYNGNDFPNIKDVIRELNEENNR